MLATIKKGSGGLRNGVGAVTAHDSRYINLSSSGPDSTSFTGNVPIPVIDEDSMELYRLVVKRGYLDLNDVFETCGNLGSCGGQLAGSGQLGEVVKTLLGLHLLRRAPDNPELLFPVSPETAQAELLSPLDLEITRRQQVIEMLRGQLLVIASAYNEYRPKGTSSRTIEILETRCALWARLEHATLSCERFAVIAYGNHPPTAERLATILPMELAMLERGVTLRILLPHSARNRMALLPYVKEIRASGADIRTSAHHWDHDFALFDDTTALIATCGGMEQPTRGGLAIGDETLLHLFGSMLEWAWTDSVPLLDQGDDEHAVASEVKRSVARLLEMGLKDEAIARRLGLSLRTCRKRIAELMEELDSTSRFQAGAQAVRRGLLG